MVKGLDVSGIKLHRRKGQHILMDEGVIDRQIDYAGVTGDDTVLEIGPGLGALTLKLADRVGKVVAIEKDTRLFSHLKGQIPPNVELINGDVMDFELPDFDVVVSNLPYQISSPVTFKLLQHEFRKAILMYQREFALRMTAKPGGKKYSRLTVNVFYKAKCRILEFVPRNAFHPIPEVDSAIVELIPRKPPFKVIDEVTFFEVVEALFTQRRKMVKNSLLSYITKALRKNGTYNKSASMEIVQGLPFKDERVEKLSPERIGALADNIHLSVHKN